MIEFLATFAVISFLVWWLFPGKKERQRRRIARLEHKLGLTITGEARDLKDMRVGLMAIDFLKIKNTEDGCILFYKRPTRKAKVTITITDKEEFSSSYSGLPLFISVEGIGSTKASYSMNCIIEPLMKSGPVKNGQQVARIYTKGEKMEAHKARMKAAEEQRERERQEERERYIQQQEEERKKREEWWEREGKFEAERKKEEALKKEIAEKLKEKQRRQELEKIVRQELIDSGELFGDQPKRPPIPREVADAVFKRDGGRCVYCGATENLQFDHIIPFSKGGATTIENLQLLCQKCNLEKSNKIG